MSILVGLSAPFGQRLLSRLAGQQTVRKKPESQSPKPIFISACKPIDQPSVPSWFRRRSFDQVCCSRNDLFSSFGGIFGRLRWFLPCSSSIARPDSPSIGQVIVMNQHLAVLRFAFGQPLDIAAYALGAEEWSRVSALP